MLFPGAWKFARSTLDKKNKRAKLLPCSSQFRCLSVVIHYCKWDLRHLMAPELRDLIYDDILQFFSIA